MQPQPTTLISIEERLRQLEERYQALAAATGALHWTTDSAGMVMTDPSAWVAFSGQTTEQVQGTGWLERVHPADRQRLAEAWQTDQAPQVVSFRALNAAGEYRRLQARRAPVRDASGAIREWVILCADITDHQQADQAYRQKARQLEAILAAMPERVAIFDAEGTLIHLNPAGQANAGSHRGGERLDQYPQVYDLRSADGAPLTVAELPLARALRGEVTPNIEIRMSGPDGRDELIAASAAQFYDEHGQIAGVVAVTRDITDQRRLEHRTQVALEALLAMAHTLVTPSHAGEDTAEATATRLAELAQSVLGCDRLAIVQYDATTGLQDPLAIVGIPPEMAPQWKGMLAGTRLDEYMAPDHLAQLAAGVSIQLDVTPPKRQEASFGSVIALISPLRIGDQLVGTLSLDFGPVPHTYSPAEIDMANAVAHLVAVLIERERLLAERAQAHLEALAWEEATRRMNEFLGIASHELRTPVTVIQAHLQLLLRRRQGKASTARGDEVDLLQRTTMQVQRLTRLLNDLVDVSRIRAGKLELRPERCDLLHIVQEVVEAQRLTEQERVITLELPKRAALSIMADADHIGQVVTNYLTNALKYSDSDQPVRVRVSVADGAARVSVTDRGPGIARDQQAHIWEVFHRAPGIEVRSGSGVGLGLGLHICRTIIERNGGQVGVSSQSGHGATFWFALPLAD